MSLEGYRGHAATVATPDRRGHPLNVSMPSAPSYTILSLPDDFVHPQQPRTMTVREMARFQSFPDSFEFRSQVTTGGENRRFKVPQYTQVGNAVPPKLAKAVGLAIKAALEAAQRRNEEDCSGVEHFASAAVG